MISPINMRLVFFLSLVLLSSIICGQHRSTDTCNCEPDKEVVFGDPEKLPAFPGGAKALMTYLSENIVYPQLAIDSAYEDTVFISFCVRISGKLTDLEVLRGKYEVLNKEALSVISEMPNWEPAENRGVKLCYSQVIPVRFFLDKPSKRELRKGKRE